MNRIKVRGFYCFACLWLLGYAPVLGQANKDSLTQNKVILNTKTSEDLMKEAIVHFDGGRYAKSIEHLDEAIKINEYEQLTDILYYYRAVAKTKSNLLNEAIADYSKAIEIKPLKSKYLYHRALAYFQLGDYEKAKTDFQSTLSLDGGNADIYIKLGFLKQQENNLQEAIEDYTKAIEFNPKLADAYYYRGLIYLQVLLSEKACADLQKALNLGHILAIRHLDKYCED